MGVYIKMENVYQNGRPVYKMESGDQYLFAFGRWLIGADYTSSSSGVRSVEEGRIEINGLTWQFYGSGSWQDDSTLKVEGSGRNLK